MLHKNCCITNYFDIPTDFSYTQYIDDSCKLNELKEEKVGYARQNLIRHKLGIGIQINADDLVDN